MGWWTKYVGIPFEDKGRTTLSVDCWGLVRLVYKIEKEIDLPSYDECYDHTNDVSKIDSHIKNEWAMSWSHPDAPESFDIIILKRRGVPMHVGIVTRPGFMLHCEQGAGTVHEKYTSMRWENKLMGFARWQN